MEKNWVPTVVWAIRILELGVARAKDASSEVDAEKFQTELK